ncbi:phosphatase PAP2 family protein [Chelatococcus sambhunathii]|uniref:Phosphatase PAP2 family protein n=1 Tax=Chelatococcus sambhunathii TaxID=363953 RepID=A0ABU1DEN2_9HYPH|nr:phosphatase PAP2 family protein [Chelatococcus sambhunathii]MDR4306542.1 phosphatase PAP2 family protein [Chelatococcus sambhunathii]
MSLSEKAPPSTQSRIASWRLPEFGPLIGFAGVAGLGFAFVKIADEMVEGETHDFDSAILLALRQAGDPKQPIGPHWLEGAMIDLTSLGSVPVLTLLSVLAITYFLVARRYASALFLSIAITGGALLNAGLKIGFARPRPDMVEHLVSVQSLSFPSGHAMSSAVIYLTIGALLAQSEPRWALRGYILTVSVLLTLAIGVSRVFLGVHYPTDVLAGWSLGAAWALLCWMVARWLRPQDHETERGKGRPAPRIRPSSS